jgi:hypothetical protein
MRWGGSFVVKVGVANSEPGMPGAPMFAERVDAARGQC